MIDLVEREIETVDAATRAFLEMAAFYNAACAASDAGDEDEAERCAALGEDAERRAMALKREALRLKTMA